MKKLFLAVAALAMLATSCTKDDVTGLKGDKSLVSFEVSAPTIGTRADAYDIYGKGFEVERLHYAAYLKGSDKVLFTKCINNAFEGEALSNSSVELKLVNDQWYDIIFWADDLNSPYVFDPATKSVSIDASKLSQLKSQDETLDGFFGQLTFEVKGPKVERVELTRPFAQLNIATADIEAAKTAGVTIDDAATTAVTVSGVYTSFNLLTKLPLGEPTSVTFGAAPKAQGQIVQNVDKPYDMLAMNYLLVNDRKLVDVTFDVQAAAGQKVNRVFQNVPVERNFRTNILGNLFTDNIGFEVVINPIFKGIHPNNEAEKFNMAAQAGGTYTLSADLEIPHCTFVNAAMTINLNGHKLEYTGTDDAVMFRVNESGALTINGEGTVKSTGYIGLAYEKGSITINGGDYDAAGCTAFQANGGEIYINDGTFTVGNTKWGTTYMLNHYDSLKEVGLIEVKGGSFLGFDPANNKAENPQMSFVPEGYESIKEGEFYTVVEEFDDILLYTDYAEVFTANGLLKWGYIAEKNKSYGLKVMRNITMPAFEVAEDAANETYVFTTTPITVDANGVPSGSNWIPVCKDISGLADAYSGHIDGNDNTISGLRILHNADYTGFIGFMNNDASLKNITFDDAVVSGANTTGIAAGRGQNGSIIENVNVTSSHVSGVEEVGGIIGRIYTRGNNVHQEALSVVKSCTTDANTVVVGSNNKVGGICGQNYGAAIVNCVNSADVTGLSSVGGIVGYSRDYHISADAYVIACGSTADATITATANNGYVGGICGYDFIDLNSHKNTKAYILGCYSHSTISGDKSGSILGQSNNGNITVTGSYGVNNGATKAIGSGSVTGVYYSYDAVAEVAQADVDAMVQAIADFNALNIVTLQGESVTCPYTWTWTSGNWPTIQ